MNGHNPNQSSDLRHKFFAAFVLIVSLVVYLITVQRTLSLWDCGEFVACSYILGVAHPPGTPLFLLIGRVFSLLPIAADISLRINLLSVVSGAFAAMFGYLVSVRLLFFLPRVAEDSSRRLAAYFCSAVGGLLFAFSRTNWLNAVEAEVYSLSMLLMFVIIWLSLRWYECRGSAKADRYLVLIAYLGVMSIGIHMTVFLVMPAVFAFIILADSSLRRDLRFWITGVLLFLVTVNIIWFFIGALVWIVITLLGFLQSRTSRWALVLLISTAAMVGYSTHVYIPIRAANKPSINENNPENLKRFSDYIARKQYGSKSMFEKMFNRRGSWANQLGDFPRLGFGGFLVGQYGLSGWAFLLPLCLTIIGIIALIRWKWKVGVFIAVSLLLFTIGLALYMNFADGSTIQPVTGNDRLEVRDRDYFFTPGFVLFAMCIGLGLFWVTNKLIDRVGRSMGTTIAAGLGVIFMLLPLAALTANYSEANRSNNYFPYDYAYNILMTCPQDAILFTNGDNDTFPVWCLQEVYGVRRDVRVVNLSLLQIDWYQLQMKYEKNVPISFEDEQMIWVDTPDRQGRIIQRPAKPYVDHLRNGWRHFLMAFQEEETGRLVSVAHQMIENIIATNQWKHPILFANTYPSEVAYNLGDHMKRRGWLYQLVPEESKEEWDVEATMHLLEDVYRFRGLDDPKVYRDPVATTLIIGSVQMIMELADDREKAGDTATAARVTDLMIEKVPEYWQTYGRKTVYDGMNQAQSDSLVAAYFDHLDALQEHNPDNVYYYQYRGMILQYLGRIEESVAAYEESYRINPALPITYRSLLGAYYGTNRRDEAVAISREYLKTNPHDQTAQAVAAGRF